MGPGGSADRRIEIGEPGAQGFPDRLLVHLQVLGGILHVELRLEAVGDRFRATDQQQEVGDLVRIGRSGSGAVPGEELRLDLSGPVAVAPFVDSEALACLLLAQPDRSMAVKSTAIPVEIRQPGDRTWSDRATSGRDILAGAIIPKHHQVRQYGYFDLLFEFK